MILFQTLKKIKSASASASGSASNAPSEPSSPHKPAAQSKLKNTTPLAKVPDLGSKKEQ
jgi:hypothetical protein